MSEIEDGTKEKRLASPIDEMDVPDRLPARVVAPGAAPRLHGYDLQADLATHYRFSEIAALALLGEAPSPAAGRVFEVALTFACSATIAEAPAHASALSRLCGARPSSVAAVAATALAEEARHRVLAHAPLLAWLDGGRAGAPPEEPVEDPATARLHGHLEALGHPIAAGDRGLPLGAALLAVFHDVGLRQPGSSRLPSSGPAGPWSWPRRWPTSRVASAPTPSASRTS
jgi:hypothetical protein